MFVVDYYLFEEAFQPGGAGFERQSPQEGSINSPVGIPSSGLVEFEEIKKYLLYGKLKQLKLKLDLAKINRNDVEILELYEFLNIVMLFYNTFTYEQASAHVNRLVEIFSQVLNIKIPEDDESAPATLDPNKVQQLQAAQTAAINQDQEAQPNENSTSNEIKRLEHAKKEAVLARRDANLARKSMAQSSRSKSNINQQNFLFQGA